MLKIKPLGDRVVIEPIPADEKTAGGIIIPDAAKEKPQKGKVVAVGKGVREHGISYELETKVGDVVLYGKYVGTELTLEGKDYLIMKEAEIFAIV